VSTPNATSLFDLKPWQIGDVRLTAFRTPALSEPGAELKKWEALVGKRPETVNETNYGLEGEASGPFILGGKLRLRWSHGVIQWMLERSPDTDRPETFFWMNPEVLVPFKELMRRWLIDCPPLRRLAFGAALYLPVKDRREAYDHFERLLHLGLKYSDDEGDLVYQYNRRRLSQSVSGVKINRLSKWTWVPLELRTQDDQPVRREEACLLEVDINTAPEFQGTLPHDRYVQLFEEMVGLAVEIAARGDVP
jgi:hypothetical protein